MSRQLYDFRCPEGHVDEYFVDLAVQPTVECNICGKEAKRLISPVRIDLEGLTGDFPGAADKWVKKREEKIRLEKRERERHGEPS